MFGCQATNPTKVGEPQYCPGVPPARDFGITVNDILSNPEFTDANNALVIGKWAIAEEHYMTVLEWAKTSSVGDNYRKYVATALFHALCMQGKHQKAANIARQYNVQQ